MNESVKMTFRQRIENFWYHHKWKTIIVLFLVFTFAVCFAQCATRVNPDQTVFMYLNRNTTTNNILALTQELEVYFDDRNSDGEVELLIDNVSYKSDISKVTDTGLTTATKVLGEIGACNSIIYIVDETQFDYYMSEDLRLFENLGLPDMDGYAWCWSGSALQSSLEEMGYDLGEDLYFCIRRVGEGTTADGNDKIELYENAKAALERIMDNTPVQEQ